MRWTNSITLDAEVLCPSGVFEPAWLLESRPQSPFADEALDLIADFSTNVLNSKTARLYPEIVALGFWMRRANIFNIKSAFNSVYRGRTFVGKGLVFHIAPSNVDTMFVYSVFLSVLAGNTNIVRVSEKLNGQLQCIIGLLAETFGRRPEMARRLLLVRYGHDDRVTGQFSAACNVRVIWGGDETVRKIRSIPMPPHAFELAFSGKFSVAVLNAEAWNIELDKRRVAKAFCNDSLTFNQQGCASPKLVYWYGPHEEVAAARTSFWRSVDQAVAEVRSYSLQPADAINRLVAACSMAINSDGLVRLETADDHSFVHLLVHSLGDINRQANTGNGLFYEYATSELAPLLFWLGDSDQTVTSYGVSRQKWEDALITSPPKGICRIVQFGKGLDFSSVWDGYDIVRYLCREIVVDVKA